ncbi:MAG: arginine--tRNA ligase [Candidatus Omnitrophota bacterium]
MKSFYDKVSQALENAIKDNYAEILEHPLWELPQKQEFGDLSSMAALKLASKLKKEPLEIATQLKASLEKTLLADVERIEILRPGFVNIFFSQEVLINSLNKILQDKDDFFRAKIKRRVLLEFLSANPTGPLSIAHGRQAVVGDTIGNILKFFGNDVVKEYYVNDAGKQMDLLVSSVQAWLQAPEGQEAKIPEGGYHGEYVKDIADEVLKNKDKLEKPNKLSLKEFIIEHILNDFIKKDLNSLGIKFDSWISQQKIIDKKEVEAAVEYLNEKGLIYEKQGALWFSSTKFGDDKDRVIRKEDGELTYFASDIAYHKDKIERKFTKLINLWGPDHHGYIKRVESAISALPRRHAGALKHKKDILKIIIIQLVTLKTKEKMSKRSGQMVLLSNLIRDVGKDTARFYYLTRRNSSHLEFDIDLAKEMSFNNPLYYIQYVCARVESIFKKAKAPSFNSEFSKLLTNPEELNLLRTLLQFSYCLDKAYSTLEPIFIIEYLRNLASAFHRFYEGTRVLTEDENITQARLNLLQALKIVFHSGLGLLGITPVEKM